MSQHSDIYEFLPEGANPEKGFLTSDGEFLDRSDAMKLAKKTGIVSENTTSSMLLSNHLIVYYQRLVR